jgi:hypothetical protein
MFNGKYFFFLFRDVPVWNLPRSSAILIQMLSTLLKILIIKPTKCTNFANVFILEWNSTCFGQFLCPSSGVFYCTHSNGICQTGLLTACEQDQYGTSWSCPTAVSKPVWHIPLLFVQWKTPDAGQRNCPKHVEFHSKIKTFEKLVHLVGFIIINFSRCTAMWTSDLPYLASIQDYVKVGDHADHFVTNSSHCHNLCSINM